VLLLLLLILLLLLPPLLLLLPNFKPTLAPTPEGSTWWNHASLVSWDVGDLECMDEDEDEDDAPFIHASITQLDLPNAHQAQHRPKSQFDEEAVLTHDDD